MSSKVLVIFAVLCLLGSCWGDDTTTRALTRHEDIPIEPLGAPTDPDLNQDASFWRFWKFWKWGRSMFKKVFTRSSDMAESASAGRHRIHEDRPKRKLKNKFGDDWNDTLSTARAQSTARLTSDSGASLVNRPWGSVQKEIVTSLFESMLDSIVDSWTVLSQQKQDDSTPTTDLGKTPSEVTFTSKKKRAPGAKSSRTKRSRSKLDFGDNVPVDLLMQTWWSSPDEKAVIHFKNGNIYEGNISMKAMHGEGRYQWSDGTVYLGHFYDNEMKGKGSIFWKDDTWYQGDFSGNLRHGKGLYVDSRNQRSYAGGWHCGTKHGQGVIHYSANNSYDGDWIHNVRHGFGTREYCAMSGYIGEWDKYVRDGKGMMIWPNHDFYRGDWKNGVMSGYGIYIWDTYYNNSMSLPSINSYRGQWERGHRNGYGVLNLGLGLGSHYKGQFKDNKKHGHGKFVTNNGLILKDKYLYIEDILGPHDVNELDKYASSSHYKLCNTNEPFQFDICDDTTGLSYHIKVAYNNIDKQEETRCIIINKYIENNRSYETRHVYHTDREEPTELDFNDLMEFEENSLRKAIRNYETDLKNIYYKYATICNSEPINFTPILIRLFLWQLYYDCDIHKKGLTHVEIDKILYQNPDWLIEKPHDPFAKIYFWQFLHSLISIANRLYAKRCLPGPKPDTIVASAFRTFMEKDILPGYNGVRKGLLTNGYGSFIPLKALYALYCALGEPHTVRQFLCAVHRQTQNTDISDVDLVEASDESAPIGRNAYLFGDEMTFVKDEATKSIDAKNSNDLKLFNFSNLSTKAIIKIFAQILPHVCENDTVMDLNIEITFFEFFEVFVMCAEESIRVKEEELHWRQKFCLRNETSHVYAGHGGELKSKTLH